MEHPRVVSGAAVIIATLAIVAVFVKGYMSNKDVVPISQEQLRKESNS